MSTSITQVTFSPGAPLDANKLNQLQNNISSLYQDTKNLNTTTVKVGDVEKTVKAIMIVDAGQKTVIVNGQTSIVDFTNKTFDQNPIIVASISSDLKPKTVFSVRANSISAQQARIEVTSPDEKASGPVTVNYIAIQMKVQP